VLQVLPGLSDAFKLWGGIGFCSLLGVGGYNQFIEMGAQDELTTEIDNLESIIECKDQHLLDVSKEKDVQIEELSARVDFWERKVEDFAQLDKFFSELVLYKSQMWMEAAQIAKNQSVSAGVEFIRTKNALKVNVDRIIVSLYRYFDRYSVAAIDRHFRVAYFVPNSTNDKLTLMSWSTYQQVSPKASSWQSPAFARGGASLASYIWTRSEDVFKFVHDTNEYLKQNNNSGVFSALNGNGCSHIGSIVCYRVEDSWSGAFLGVLSVDCNYPGVFDGEIGEDVCRAAISSFAQRIVFENRFSSMKDALGPYHKGN